MKLLDKVFRKIHRKKLLDEGSIDTPLFTIDGEHTAKVVKVYDADTVHVVMEFNKKLQRFKIRLLGINAPEVRGDEKEIGIESKDALSERILDQIVTLKCDGTGKYGRVLGTIYHQGENINDWLVENGLAQYKEY